MTVSSHPSSSTRQLEFWRTSAAIARIFPHASAASVANIDFVRVALLSGVGLLLSLSVLILDQYITGEWFESAQVAPQPREPV